MDPLAVVNKAFPALKSNETRVYSRILQPHSAYYIETSAETMENGDDDSGNDTNDDNNDEDNNTSTIFRILAILYMLDFELRFFFLSRRGEMQARKKKNLFCANFGRNCRGT